MAERAGRQGGVRAVGTGFPPVANAVTSLANLNEQVETFLKEVRQA